MSHVSFAPRRRLLALLVSAWCAVVVLPGYAADVAAPAAPATTVALPTAPSPNATINLIRLMVERGLIPAADAEKLIAQAEAEAVQARTALAVASAQPAAAAPVADDTVRVTYIPGNVRRQMVEEVRQDVMSQAVDENWAAPRTFPEWVSRWKFNGDIRVRYEGITYPSGNITGLNSNFWNYNAINTSSTPYDVTGAANPPINNVDQNRDRTRFRVRLGADIDLEEGFTSGVRIATGESNSPVSQNQSFGAAGSGEGGKFSKYSILLDRGFLKYENTISEVNWSLTLGRFDNPFFSTTMLWANDLGFDGLVYQGRVKPSEDRTFRPFLTVGMFPVFNTDLNFASTNPNKFKSTDKWLTAAQIGYDWTINKDFTAKAAVAIYDFQNIEGQLSDPYTPVLASDAGSTDSTRPTFAQKGNTYMALRNITPAASNGFGTTNQYQYFGLATPFRDVVVTGRLDYNHFDPIQISLIGEAVQNVAFNRGDVAAVAVNNLRSSGNFGGGDFGYLVNFQVGHAVLDKRWDWNVAVGYRYVESDAVVDGFTDSDFGGGGTNLKGYTLGGNLALSRRVWVGLKLMAADSIAGPTYKNDILQLDFNGRF